MNFCYDRLKGKIKEKYATQEIFARKIGMDKSALNMRLKNHRSFKQSEIIIICKALEIPMEKLHEYFFRVQKNS